MGKLNVDVELTSASWWVRLLWESWVWSSFSNIDDELADEEDEGKEEEVRPMVTTWEPFGPFSLVLIIVDGWIGLQLSNESVFNDLVDEEADDEEEDDDDDDEDVDEEELIR